MAQALLLGHLFGSNLGQTHLLDPTGLGPCRGSFPFQLAGLEAAGRRLEARRRELEDGGWRLEARSWRLEVEAGGWLLEAGGWKLEAGGRDWRLAPGG